MRVGQLQRFPLEGEAGVVVRPARGWDMGAGPGQEMQARVKGGEVGLVLDGRGRPIRFAEPEAERLAQISAWNQALELY